MKRGQKMEDRTTDAEQEAGRGTTRRRFLQQAAGTGLVAVAGAGWLTAAEAGNPAAGGTAGGVQTGVAPTAEPGVAAQAFDLNNLHASVQTTLGSGNAAQLAPAWTLPTAAPVSHTPLVDSGRLYFAD